MLSIITITYNNLEGLKKTHRSIEGQSSDNYEWIIVDGNSDDGTASYLNFTNATFIREEDEGIYDAMNKGLKYVSGSHILFLNAGDCLGYKDAVQDIDKIITDTKPDFIYGDSIEQIKGRYFPKKSRPHTKAKQGMFTHHQSMIYASKFFEELSYDVSYEIAADYDLTMRVLNECDNIHYLPQPICAFEAGGISQQKFKEGRKEQFEIRKKLGVSDFKNKTTYFGQMMMYNLRRFMPPLYWLLKRF